jgi:hypothetical protein
MQMYCTYTGNYNVPYPYLVHTCIPVSHIATYSVPVSLYMAYRYLCTVYHYTVTCIQVPAQDLTVIFNS